MAPAGRLARRASSTKPRQPDTPADRPAETEPEGQEEEEEEEEGQVAEAAPSRGGLPLCC